MLRLPIHQAAPGMTTALPVLHPEKHDHLLLKPGVRLDADMVAALIELRVPALWIEYPPTAFLLEYASPAIMAEHGRLAATLGSAFDRVREDNRADLEFHVFSDSVRSLVHRLVDEPRAAVFVEGIVESKRPLLEHSANVCMLALLMGLKLDGYLVEQRPRISPRRAQNVENLGVGAMLHDVGMLRIDPAVAQRWWANFDEGDPAWRRHTLLGFEMLRGRIPATAAGIALHHHQRMDGSGFPRKSKPPAPPRGLAGPEIHIFSRIVAVADVFGRARMARAGAEPAPAVHALRRVRDEVAAGRLDPVVFKALLSVVPAYPPGMVVELNDGRTCVVNSWDRARPCSPQVRPMLGLDAGSGNFLLGAPIELAQHPSLFIARVDGTAVGSDNFHPGSLGGSGLAEPAEADGMKAAKAA
jgi:HD-GYP domain-containing protein (c-di-GMP phosphodiesterase class II)